MTDYSGPWDEQPWSEAQWFQHMAPSMPPGVIGTPASSVGTGELPLTLSGLNWTVGVGRANCGGSGFYRDAAASGTVNENTHSTQSRRDRIVLRRDLAAHATTITRKQGTPSASPTAPTLTQDPTGVWEEPLFSFLVPPNSGTALTGAVDERKWVDPGGYGSQSHPTPATRGQTAPKGYVDDKVAAHNPLRMMRAYRPTDIGGFINGQWDAFLDGTGWEELDPHNMHGTGGRILAPWAGWYLLFGGVHFGDQDAGGARGARLNPPSGVDIGAGDGLPFYVSIVGAPAIEASIAPSGPSLPVYLPAGTVIQLEGYQNSGAPLTVLNVWVGSIFLGANA